VGSLPPAAGVIRMRTAPISAEAASQPPLAMCIPTVSLVMA
jgi:hypothetical protein